MRRNHPLFFHISMLCSVIMDMHWTPPAAKSEDEREIRVSKLLTLEISSARHPRAKIVVRNLSPHGMGVRSDLEVLPCEHVTLYLPNGTEVGGIVRWVRKGTFGLSLDDRIEPDMLQPNTMGSGQITPCDSEIGFQRLQHTGTTVRSGFQRSHREQVLNNSRWIND